MKTFVKVEGSNVEPIVKKLANIAVDFKGICVWDINILDMGWTSSLPNPPVGEMGSYFGMDSDTFEKNCDRIISKTSGDLGDASIYFEWNKKPNDEQLKKLNNLIKGIMKPYENKFTITNKE